MSFPGDGGRRRRQWLADLDRHGLQMCPNCPAQGIDAFGPYTKNSKYLSDHAKECPSLPSALNSVVNAAATDGAARKQDQAAPPSPTSTHAPPPPPPTPSQAEAAGAAAVRDRQSRPSANTNSAAPTFDRVRRLPDDAQAAALADRFTSSLPIFRGRPQVQ